MTTESQQSSNAGYGEQLFTIQDLVHLGNEVLQTLSKVRNVQSIPGCCTQGCCDPGVLEMLGRPPDFRP